LITNQKKVQDLDFLQTTRQTIVSGISFFLACFSSSSSANKKLLFKCPMAYHYGHDGHDVNIVPKAKLNFWLPSVAHKYFSLSSLLAETHPLAHSDSHGERVNWPFQIPKGDSD